MTDITSSDIPQGQEVKWYQGGVSTHETITATAGQTSVTLASSAVAEYGSTFVMVNGIPVTHLEYSGASPATEASGTDTVTFSAVSVNDAIDVYYLKTSGAGNSLVHIASCLDVKRGGSASTKTNAVHGQATKLISIGAVENTVDLEEFYYNLALVGAAMGDLWTDAPLIGGYKWTNKFTGVKKIGAIVGKRYDSSGVVTRKWFLYGAQTTGIDSAFPTEDLYKNSCKFSCDFMLDVTV
jgi:hypothetical protein